MSGHTATPWEVIAGDDYYIRADAYPEEFVGRFKSDDTGPYVACVGNRPADFGEANAAFIVTACNSHADLVRALEFYADPLRYDGPNQRVIGDDPYTPKDRGYLQDVTRDNGDIARAALAKLHPAKGNETEKSS
jgi:hypothetical protein